MSEVTNVRVNLGPRMIMVGSEALGTSDNISIEIAKATPEEPLLRVLPPLSYNF